MDMNEPSPTRDKRLAPLVQAGLAALVAGSLLMFSAIAFRTGFLDDEDGGVRAAAAGTASARPVVLPAATLEPALGSRPQTSAPESIAVAELAPGAEVVLGTRVDKDGPTEPRSAPTDTDRHARERGGGHDKGGGRGHHKYDDSSSHSRGPDDDDDSDHSRSSSGASHGRAKHHKHRGSKHHGRGGSRHCDR
jgi:hypothetical protein